jgi:hypothetical protein
MYGAGAGAAISTTRMGVTGNISGGYIPSHVDKERGVEEYFDKLSYVKYRGLATDALAMGDLELAQIFDQKSQGTRTYGLASLRETGNQQAYLRTLDREERAYFEVFVKASLDKQAAIMEVVPSHMQEALKMVYGGGSRPLTAEEDARAYFAEHGLPNRAWIGWHPSIPDDAIRIKSIQGGINNLASSANRMGFYPSQIRETNVRYPFLEPIGQEVWDDSGIDWLDEMFRPSPTNFSFGVGPGVSVTTVDLMDDRQNDIFYFMNDIRSR